MSATLHKVVRLARELSAELPGTDLGRTADSIVRSADERLRLAIAGRMKAGKSTLLNALVGEPLAATDAAECTRVVTRYRTGVVRRATIVRRDGSSMAALLQRLPSAVEVDLAGTPTSEIRRLDVEWPARSLDTWTLLDTPGLGSVNTDISSRGVEPLTEGNAYEAVDAVLYLIHHVHPGDWRFLTAFHDDAGVGPDPACAAAVLSRADEVGGGCVNALDIAAEAALRHSSDPAVRRYCQTVVPVVGLLAQGAASLTDGQYRFIGRLAADSATDEALFTAERFVTWPDVAGTESETRAVLLASLGLFGVRQSVALIRLGEVSNATALALALRRASGLDELEELIHDQFLARRDALRARAALRTLSAAAAQWGGDHARLAVALERIEAEDHEVAELAVLAAARAGDLRLPDAERADLEQQLDPTPLVLGRLELLTALERWHARSEHPLARPMDVMAARTVVRSIERRLVALPAE